MTNPQVQTATSIIVDTDVTSYIFNDDTRAGFFKPYLTNKLVVLSFMTVSELYYGAYKASWGQKRIASLEEYLRSYVVLPYDPDLCRVWAKVRTDCERGGYTIAHGDAWIAAAAIKYQCALATNNRRHFQQVKDVALISPA